MFFDKRRYLISIRGGKGQVATEALRGIVQQLIVRPSSPLICWDMCVLDSDGDELFELRDFTGRYDGKEVLAIGRDDMERLTIKFSRVSENKPIKVIFKIKEL